MKPIPRRRIFISIEEKEKEKGKKGYRPFRPTPQKKE
jgi:hypothetical protein